MGQFYKPSLSVQSSRRLSSSHRYYTCHGSSNRLLNELVLQPLHLLLERLDLLPAVQRSAVVHPQACDNVLLGLGQLGVDLLQLLPLVELGAQLLDLLCDARPAHVLLLLLLGERGRGRCRVGELLGERGFRLLGLLAGQGLAELGEVLRCLLAQLLELGRQALLVLQLLRFRARGIRLMRLSALFCPGLRCGWRATHKGVLLQRVYQFVREADGVVSAQTISICASCTHCIATGSHWVARGHSRREDMLLDLRGGLRVLCAHVAAVGGAGCQRDDAAARRSRSDALAGRCGAL
jgi:hypothetical protein